MNSASPASETPESPSKKCLGPLPDVIGALKKKLRRLKKGVESKVNLRFCETQKLRPLRRWPKMPQKHIFDPLFMWEFGWESFAGRGAAGAAFVWLQFCSLSLPLI